MDSFYEAIAKIQNQDLFIYTDPDVLDFTSGAAAITATKKASILSVDSKSVSLQIPLNIPIIKLRECLGVLQMFLGGEDAIIITWNLKNFLSYARGRTGVDFRLKGNIFDLSFLESYSGENNECPKNLAESRQRLAKLIKNPNWSRVNNVYQKVYLPLIKSIPKIETYGLFHKQKKAKVFSNYTIDGQINGRMKCSNVYSSSYNPHSLGFEEKQNLRAPGFDYCFLNFDFKYMEVSVLQWLSDDQDMGEILKSGEDFYAKMWEILTESPSNPERRKICKSFFLPIFYGLGADSLSEKIQWSVDACKTLIDRIHKILPVASNWMKSQQNKVDGEAFDYYKRRRLFDNPYKVRNFVVQSPAALICLHKLTQVIETLGDLGVVCMHIHDGYILVTKKDNLHKTYNLTKQILESEDELYPGLKLKTGCTVGVNLNEMQIFPN